MVLGRQAALAPWNLNVTVIWFGKGSNSQVDVHRAEVQSGQRGLCGVPLLWHTLA